MALGAATSLPSVKWGAQKALCSGALPVPWEREEGRRHPEPSRPPNPSEAVGGETQCAGCPRGLQRSGALGRQLVPVRLASCHHWRGLQLSWGTHGTWSAGVWGRRAPRQLPRMEARPPVPGPPVLLPQPFCGWGAPTGLSRDSRPRPLCSPACSDQALGAGLWVGARAGLGGERCVCGF